jgi:hypothetical protein
MNKQTETSATLYLLAFRSSLNTKEYIRYISPTKPSGGDDTVLLGEMSVTMYDSMTDADIDKGTIKSLEVKRDTMRAAASAAIAEVDGEIASLLALENTNEKS